MDRVADADRPASGSAPRADRLVEVAIALPVRGTFHYLAPPGVAQKLAVGTGVVVPFGTRRVTGFVVDFPDGAPADIGELKRIEALLADEPLFDAPRLELYRFMSRYYLAPLGEALRTALPPGILAATRRVARINDAGKKALATDSLNRRERAVLAALVAGGGAIEWRKLTSGSPAVSGATVRALSERGLVEIVAELAGQTSKPKYETRWRAFGEPDAQLRGARQKEVLDLLRGQPDAITASEIADALGFPPHAVLNALAARGLVVSESVNVSRVRALRGADEKPPVLTTEQTAAVAEIAPAIDEARFSPFLLHGVTGSGKTEVYLQLVERALAAGKGAIVLVPEIALTPQLVGRFVGRFGDVVRASHSGVAGPERLDLWRDAMHRRVRVVVGARSAVFAPVHPLGLIVVDEEHDGSYKQDDGIPYNARDLAIRLAKQVGCPVVLGSATPSFETYYAAQSGRYRLLRLTKRPRENPMPSVTTVDLRPLEKEEALTRRDAALEKAHAAREAKRVASDSQSSILIPQSSPPDIPRARAIFSPELATAMDETLAAGEQAILLLNRRGYSTHMFCLKCGATAMCANCDVALTYHHGAKSLVCHYCGEGRAPSAQCVMCGKDRMFYAGLGTEQVEAEIAHRFPHARVARLDRDSVTGRDGHERVTESFRRGESDILLGTQMVAKGHDFARVTLVGVIRADTTLNFPDFRAAERTFQLVTQVAGRAGRADRPGRIVIQTYNPNHWAIRCASTHDFEGFYAQEIERRRAANYPPFARLAMLRVTGLDEDVVARAARAVGRAARLAASSFGSTEDDVLGPARAPISRVKNRYRRQLLLRAQTAAKLSALVAEVFARCEPNLPSTVDLRADIDPQNVL
ncbi:primosomal protein N' [bacterium]|nr:primosomal protein N' [bacterium]